jgi:hypothetical protein
MLITRLAAADAAATSSIGHVRQIHDTQARDAYINETSQVQTSAGLVRDAVRKMSNFKPTQAPAVNTP